jgi:putative redox protein
MAEATVFLNEGMQFSVETGSGHRLIIDARAEVGGQNAGPRPMELMAASIAGCTAMDVISILRKMKQEVTRFSVKTKSVDAEEHPKRFLELHIEYLISGPALEEEKVKRAIELSETRYCPASATLRPGVRITSSYQLIDA